MDLKDHFILCFCMQCYLYSSVHKIKTQTVGGFWAFTGGLWQNLSIPPILLSLCSKYRASLVLLSQAVLVFCQSDKQSSTLTMPDTLLCASLQTGIHASVIWVMGTVILDQILTVRYGSMAVFQLLSNSSY